MRPITVESGESAQVSESNRMSSYSQSASDTSDCYPRFPRFLSTNITSPMLAFSYSNPAGSLKSPSKFCQAVLPHRKNLNVSCAKSERSKTLTHHVASISGELTPPLIAPVVVVPTAKDLPSPGETHTVSLHYTVLLHLMRNESRYFALSTFNESTISSTTIATLHTIQHVPSPSKDVPVEVLTAACSCEARARLTRLPSNATTSSEPKSNYFYVANVVPVHDISVSSYSDRQSLTEAEWCLWQKVNEVFTLASRISLVAENDFVPWSESDLQRIEVFAPKEYDNSLTEQEWAVTPQGNRNMWNRRAEAFSFAVFRAMQPSDEEISQAFVELSTERRILAAQSRVLQTKNRIIAALGINDAFNSS